MSQESATDRVRQAGARLHAVLVRGIAAFVVLVMFGGLAFLVYADRLDGGALLLYAGVILGYLIRTTARKPKTSVVGGARSLDCFTNRL